MFLLVFVRTFPRYQVMFSLGFRNHVYALLLIFLLLVHVQSKLHVLDIIFRRDGLHGVFLIIAMYHFCLMKLDFSTIYYIHVSSLLVVKF